MAAKEGKFTFYETVKGDQELPPFDPLKDLRGKRVQNACTFAERANQISSRIRSDARAFEFQVL